MTAIVDNGFARISKETIIRNPSNPWALTWDNIAYNSLLTINEKISTIPWGEVDVTASVVVNVPSWNLVATNVQDALNELQSDIDWLWWDMMKSVYDPTNISDDAFDMENMVEGANKKILTVAERTKLTNTSWTNTWDQTSIVWITWTKAQFNTAVTDWDIMYLDSTDTITAVKTFLNGTFGLRNVANTFTGLFTNAITSARTWTLPDVSGTLVTGGGTASGTNTGDETTGRINTLYGTTNAITVGSIELGNASDTTISRVSPWKTAVEWVNQGTEGILQNSQSTAYTLVLTDAGKHIYHPSADTTARTWTIPSNASVAFPIGTAVTFVNDTSAGTITIAITTDTLVLAWTGTTGSRTLTANGIATAIKVTSTRWIISWTNLT